MIYIFEISICREKMYFSKLLKYYLHNISYVYNISLVNKMRKRDNWSRFTYYHFPNQTLDIAFKHLPNEIIFCGIVIKQTLKVWENNKLSAIVKFAFCTYAFFILIPKGRILLNTLNSVYENCFTYTKVLYAQNKRINLNPSIRFLKIMC